MHGLKSLTPPIGFVEPRKFFRNPLHFTPTSFPPSTSNSLFLSPPSCRLPPLHPFPPTPLPPHPLALTLSPSSLSPSLSPSRLSGISLSLLPKHPQFHPPTTTLSFSLHISSPSSPFHLPSTLPSHPQYPPFSHFSTTNLTPPPSPNTPSLTLSTILPIHGSTYPRDNLSPIHSFTNTPSPLWANLTRITALPTAVFATTYCLPSGFSV